MGEYDWYSEKVSEFAEFLREIQEIYAENKPLEHQADAKTQDILHTLELDPVKYRDCALLAIRLTEIRQERREAKDTVRHAQPIIDWIVANQKAVNTLSNLYGDLKKLEKADRQRIYEHRTDAVEAVVQNLPGRVTVPALHGTNAESTISAPGEQQTEPVSAPAKKPGQSAQPPKQPTKPKQMTKANSAQTKPKQKSKKP